MGDYETRLQAEAAHDRVVYKIVVAGVVGGVLAIGACIAGATIGSRAYQDNFTERFTACIEADNHPLECMTARGEMAD